MSRGDSGKGNATTSACDSRSCYCALIHGIRQTYVLEAIATIQLVSYGDR